MEEIPNKACGREKRGEDEDEDEDEDEGKLGEWFS